MNNIIKDNWKIIKEKVIKSMYEDGSFPLTVADEITKALQKQIPKKVIHNKLRNEYDCPSCKEYIKEDEYFGYPIGEDENHCKICGQALKWEE